ncbi:MAG: hypothetical protein ABW003_01855 [Microvirga sp.]
MAASAKAARAGKPIQPRSPETPGSVGTVAEVVKRPPPTISVYGDFVDQITAIHSSLMSPVFGMGKLEDGSSVLIPYVEVKLGGEPRDGGTTDALFSGITTFENAAFLLSDLASDFAFSCEQVGQISTGALQPEPQRMAEVLKLLDRAGEDLRAAADAIRCLTAVPAEA